MKARAKLFIILVAAILLFILYGVDALLASTFTVKAISARESVPADGMTSTEIEVRVTKKGKPVAGHVLYALTQNGGSFKSVRMVTDNNGYAVFVYYPYLKTGLNKLTDVTLKFSDESNSLFFSVPAKTTIILPITEPEEQAGDYMTTDDIFD